MGLVVVRYRVNTLYVTSGPTLHESREKDRVSQSLLRAKDFRDGPPLPVKGRNPFHGFLYLSGRSRVVWVVSTGTPVDIPVHTVVGLWDEGALGLFPGVDPEERRGG